MYNWPNNLWDTCPVDRLTRAFENSDGMRPCSSSQHSSVSLRVLTRIPIVFQHVCLVALLLVYLHSYPSPYLASARHIDGQESMVPKSDRAKILHPELCISAARPEYFCVELPTRNNINDFCYVRFLRKFTIEHYSQIFTLVGKDKIPAYYLTKRWKPYALCKSELET